jgi:nitrite reductase/ring-hydroxylating ferredoxin subunit
MHDESRPHLVCPWHGWEYDLGTGEFSGDRRLRLRGFEVQIDRDQVYVAVG